MRYGFQILPHAIIVRIFGNVDKTLGELFEKATETATKLNNRQVVIDFSQTETMDPMGLVLCGYGFHHLQQLNIPVALVRPPDSLLSVLKEHGLPEIPPLFLQTPSVSSRN